MKKIIDYFVSRHLLTNLLFFGVIMVSVFCWQQIGKEEMPEFAMDWIRVVTRYPGAPAEDVELFVTKPIEEELKSVSGLEEIHSASSLGVSSFRIFIDPNTKNKEQVIQDIKDAVLRANFPAEVRNLPTFHQFRSSEKAIIDIALVHKNKKFLDLKTRAELQKYALTFENQLLALPEVSSISRSGYHLPELQVLIEPEKLRRYEISISEVYNQIKSNHIRSPIGSLEDRGESKVTALHELDTVESLNSLVLKGSYEGPMIELSKIAKIKHGFKKSTTIYKVNGHEAIILNVKKSTSSDILAATKSVATFVERFKKTNSDSPINVFLMDDESFDVTNRLSIISLNGLIGFLLIIIVLMIFLDVKSGFWVAMGIPFSLGFTIICALLTGYTVNNMTLAGIIIVMGIVVDDAIIIAENISRHHSTGKNIITAAIDGASEVFKPILASIITTCVAFVPLMFFDGHFGKFVSYIPLVVSLMLLGSLIESTLILPSHLSSKTPLLDRFDKKGQSWFFKWEERYAKLLTSLLNYRVLIILLAVTILGILGVTFKNNMKFVMFPREEAKEVYVKAMAVKGASRLDTAKAISKLEQMFIDEGPKRVVAVRSRIGQSRRGGLVNENKAGIRVELVPRDQRDIDLNTLRKKWQEKAKSFKNLSSVKIIKSRWGRGSGSAIELMVQENDDKKRKTITDRLKAYMEKMPSLADVELEKPLIKKEYLFKINQKKLVRFDIEPSAVTTALRTFVEGSILYTINKGDEEVELRITVPEKNKKNLNDLLKLKVQNKNKQLIYLSKFTSILEIERPANIARTNHKRTAHVYANMAAETKITPIEIAVELETELFPKINREFPTTILSFTGEIEDTRESESNFRNALILVVILIYFVLVLMFNSLITPMIIVSIIPFGLGGAILVLFSHGMSVYGFFAVVGSLGMIGVVINDSIIMLDKMERESISSFEQLASVASTRLRPVIVTTITTVVAILPTAYGLAGYDSMLAEMMLVMGWGLAFATAITLLIVPCLYSFLPKKHAL
ncbi:MAG: efflux RND transporter permease subunit [Halobacteriovoraceae bacterium]|nr:efflux RND transporter permease subunit [Halobacteriovoraceae bacterium]